MSNNPIRYNDVLGDSIKVSFRTGFLGIFGKKVTLTYNSEDKRWDIGNKPYTGKTSKFANRVLNDLQKNQENLLGNEIVTNLSNDKLDHFIKNGSPNVNGTDTDNIYYNGRISTEQKIYEGGKGEYNTPGYVALGHEMAHKYSKNLGTVNYKWFTSDGKDRGVDEYNAMYYENVLRKSNGLPLKMAYTEDRDGVLQGVIFNSSGVLQNPPTRLRIRKNKHVKTMPEVHLSILIPYIKF